MLKYKSRKKKNNWSFKNILIILSTVFLFMFLVFVVQKATAPSLNIFNTQAAAQIVWPMFDGDAQKSGVNTNETAITRSTVNGLKRLWQISLPDASDGSPVYLSKV